MGRVRIYFQGCHWSIQFTNYIPALSSEKTMNGYPKREKKCGLRIKYIVGIKGYPFQSSQLRCNRGCRQKIESRKIEKLNI